MYQPYRKYRLAIGGRDGHLRPAELLAQPAHKASGPSPMNENTVTAARLRLRTCFIYTVNEART